MTFRSTYCFIQIYMNLQYQLVTFWIEVHFKLYGKFIIAPVLSNVHECLVSSHFYDFMESVGVFPCIW